MFPLCNKCTHQLYPKHPQIQEKLIHKCLLSYFSDKFNFIFLSETFTRKFDLFVDRLQIQSEVLLGMEPKISYTGCICKVNSDWSGYNLKLQKKKNIYILTLKQKN